MEELTGKGVILVRNAINPFEMAVRTVVLG
jgi:hypothetical protein